MLSIGEGATALSLLSGLSQIGAASTPASGNTVTSGTGGPTFAIGNNSGPFAATSPLTGGAGGPPSPMTPDMMSTLFSVQGATSGNQASSTSDGAMGGLQDFLAPQGDNGLVNANDLVTASPSEAETDIKSASGEGSFAPSSQTFTNPNGATTTTTTFADGSQATTTVPAASSSTGPSDAGASVGLLLGQLMREAQALGPQVGPSMSVSA